MKSYLEIQVPLRKDARWFKELKSAFSDVPVKWQVGYYHITMAFLDETPEDVDLCPLLEKHLCGLAAPVITFDKLDVFSTPSRMYIVNLTSTCVPEYFLAIIDDIRRDMRETGCQIQSDFLFHVTLGRVKDLKTDLPSLKRLVDSVTFPPFTLVLTDVDYRIFRGKVLYETKLKTLND